MQKITSLLWFKDNAEEAINFYTSISKNSKVHHVSRYPDTDPDRLIAPPPERANLPELGAWSPSPDLGIALENCNSKSFGAIDFPC